jgi:hypothetical protein
MTLPNELLPVGLLGAGADDYEIERSLRFNSADSAYLSRTFTSTGNRKTWTWAGWVKKCSSKNQQLLSCVAEKSDTQALFIDFLSDDTLRVLGWSTVWRKTTQVFRDPSAWYHIVVLFDSTQATAANRIKIYVNGSEVTTFSTNNAISQNTDFGFNQASLHEIGRYTASSVGYDYLNGYLADIHFIDGQALDPTSFGKFDENGIWQPVEYTGEYGTNGFKLDFSDNSAATATTLGKDSSGNGNNWTPNNLSVTAGSGNDSLIDVPTNGTQTDTGLGGEVRGNYCTLNPLASDAASQLSNGNLVFSGSSSLNWKYANATIGVSSGKWYWEAVCTDNSQIGIVAAISLSTESKTTGTITFRVGNYWVDGAQTSTTTFTAGNVIGFALDLESSTKTLKQYANGVLRNTINIPVNATWNNANVFAGTAVYSTSYIDTFNFGQRPFAYTAPSGFKALNTANLPTPTILDGSDYMDVALYTGNGSTQTISGLGFSPDLVWIKGRNTAYDHELYDTVRGATNRLMSSFTGAEDVRSGVTSFNSDGFSLGSAIGANQASSSNVAWTWDAGSTTVTNTTGEITSSVRANPTAGFSIVSWTSDGFAGIRTMGTGLGAEPYFIIVKNRDAVDNWFIYHNTLGINSRLFFTTGSSVTLTGQWSVSSSTFGIRQSSIASNGAKCIAYCFAPVTGYSSFGSYVGSTSQPFVYLGFRPKVVWIKFVSGGAITSYTSWFISDSERDTNNPQNGTGVLWANRSDSEGKRGDGTSGGSFLDIDFLSNGFRVLDQTNVAELNYTGATYIYAAWAESPFKYSRAR